MRWWYVAFALMIGLFNQKGAFWLYLLCLSFCSAAVGFCYEFARIKVNGLLIRSRLTPEERAELEDANRTLADGMEKAGLLPNRFVLLFLSFMQATVSIGVMAAIIRGIKLLVT